MGGSESGISGRAARRSDARARGWAGGLALAALCLAVYLPGFFALPAVDRDEARFAQASRQMFEAAALPPAERDLRTGDAGEPRGPHSGGWAIPMVLDRPRLNKPPLIYWLQAGAAWVCTRGRPAMDAIWMYRLPSLLAGISAVLLTWRWGCSMFDARAAWLAGAFLGVSPVVIWEVHQARADMVLVACTAGACWGLWETWKAFSRGRRPLAAPLAMWIAVALGVLTKGPVTPMVVLLAALCLCAAGVRGSFLGRLRPLLGAGVLLLAVAPWVLLVAQRFGLERYAELVRREVLVRSVEAQEGHEGPPGYHTLFVCFLFWPGVLFVGAGLWRALAVGVRTRAGEGPWWRRLRAGLGSVAPGRGQELFLLCVLIPGWIVFEVVSTKLPHYTMPLYPALALLSARAALASSPAVSGIVRSVHAARAAWAWWLGGLVACGAAAFVAFRGVRIELAAAAPALRDAASGAVVVLYAALALGLLRAVFAATRARSIGPLGVRGAAVAALSFPVFMLAAPYNPEPWVTRGIVRAVESLDPGGGRPVALVDYNEDSTVFESRGRFEWVEEHRLKDWLHAHPDGLVLLPGEREAGWPPFEPLRTIEGTNYTKGKHGPWRVGRMARPIGLLGELLAANAREAP